MIIGIKVWAIMGQQADGLDPVDLILFTKTGFLSVNLQVLNDCDEKVFQGRKTKNEKEEKQIRKNNKKKKKHKKTRKGMKKEKQGKRKITKGKRRNNKKTKKKKHKKKKLKEKEKHEKTTRK